MKVLVVMMITLGQMEALMSRVTSMLQETRRTASERRQREKADAVVQEELKSLRSRIASYKSAATSAKEECARLKKKMNEMSTITDVSDSRPRPGNDPNRHSRHTGSFPVSCHQSSSR